jgi:hypothetical protein
MGNIASVIGAISGVVSLLMLIYLFGFWRGQVDNDRQAFRDCLKSYPPAEMWTMVKTLWDVCIMDALRNRPDLAQHGSGYRLSNLGKELIPQSIIPLLDKIPKNPVLKEDIATGYVVVKYLGLDTIQKAAEEMKLSIPESIAIFSTYLEAHSNNHTPV